MLYSKFIIILDPSSETLQKPGIESMERFPQSSPLSLSASVAALLVMMGAHEAL